MTVRAVEWEITDADQDGSVSVNRHDDFVTVEWFCGDVRRFEAKDVEGVISNIEALSAFPDVWLQDRDYNGMQFFARVVDGRLRADTARNDDARSVPWADMVKALRKAARNRTPDAGASDDEPGDEENVEANVEDDAAQTAAM